MSLWKKEHIHPWPKEVIIYTDGASRGNPGPSSYGLIVLSSKKEPVFEMAETLGDTTNNVAEYRAVEKALELACFHKLQNVTLKADSQLLIRQLQGQYKVKSPHLVPLFKNCKNYLNKLPQTQLISIPREDNKKADRLANEILDGIL